MSEQQALAAELAKLAAELKVLDPGDVAGLMGVRERVEGLRGPAGRLVALAVADRHYLDGVSLTAMAPELDRSAQALSVQVAVVTEYLAIRRVADGGFETRWVPVQTDRNRTSARKLASMRDQGWRIVPAMWGVRRDGSYSWAELWERLDQG